MCAVLHAQSSSTSPPHFQNKKEESGCMGSVNYPRWDQIAPEMYLQPKFDSQVAVLEINGSRHRRVESMPPRPEEAENLSLLNNPKLAMDFVASLKACAKQKDLQRGVGIHKQLDKTMLLKTNVFVGSSLVHMYASCGAMVEAQEVFDMLPQQNTILWNGLITGYARHGHGKKALNCFEQMQIEGLVPDAVTFLGILKACGSLKDLERGQEIHNQLLKGNLLERDKLVGNAVIDMYAKCGAIQKAQEAFDELPSPDLVSWTTLIAGYVQHGHGAEALRCYEQMQLAGFQPDGVTYACILKACASVRALEKGEEIHARLRRECLLEKDIVIGNSLMDMYVKCGALEKAEGVFDELSHPNLVSWNELISGYTQQGNGERALECFSRMQREGFSPDAVTFATALRACGAADALEEGQKIHLSISKEGLLEKDTVVAGALVDMYARCGNVEKALEIFDELSVKDVVTWTALISGYVEKGLNEKALRFFEVMKSDGVSPNVITYSCVLNACGNIRALDMGKEIHAQIAKKHGFLEKETVLSTALVDMYSKCGALQKAKEVFDGLSLLDIAAWNALIGGYAEHGLGHEAVTTFQRMQFEGFHPDAVTFMCLLRACGSIGVADIGFKTHAMLEKLGLMDEDKVITTWLVAMYANCGMLSEAEKFFREFSDRDAVMWSALMEGYAQLGKEESVFYRFEEMTQAGVLPTPITLTIVLNACCHSGLIEKGQLYLEIFSKDYGILPSLEHHSCIISLLGHAGHFHGAIAVIEKMPFLADLTLWHSVLSMCNISINQNVRQIAFESAVSLSTTDDAAYVSMGNIPLSE